MPHTKTMSEEAYVSIMARAWAAAVLPSPEMEFDESELMMDWDAPPPVRATTSAKPDGIAIRPLPMCGTHPISIRVETRVIRAFKAQAEKTGGSYQTMMKRALREAAAGFV